MKELFEKLYKDNIEEFNKLMKKNLNDEKKMFIVTANPETFMISEKDSELNKLLNDKDTVLVPDGIGVVKASKILKMPVKERITGIDLAQTLLEYGNNLKKKIYLFGSTDEVINLLVDKLKIKYPDLIISGYSNGFVKDKDKVFNDMSNFDPDIVLVALGIPMQEKLIYKHIKEFNKGIFVGVGGSFDVLSGVKKRAPKLIIKLNLEWLYRIICEPKRIKRFYNSNIKFMVKVKKYK